MPRRHLNGLFDFAAKQGEGNALQRPNSRPFILDRNGETPQLSQFSNDQQHERGRDPSGPARWLEPLLPLEDHIETDGHGCMSSADTMNPPLGAEPG